MSRLENTIAHLALELPQLSKPVGYKLELILDRAYRQVGAGLTAETEALKQLSSKMSKQETEIDDAQERLRAWVESPPKFDVEKIRTDELESAQRASKKLTTLPNEVEMLDMSDKSKKLAREIDLLEKYPVCEKCPRLKHVPNVKTLDQKTLSSLIKTYHDTLSKCDVCGKLLDTCDTDDEECRRFYSQVATNGLVNLMYYGLLIREDLRRFYQRWKLNN